MSRHGKRDHTKKAVKPRSPKEIKASKPRNPLWLPPPIGSIVVPPKETVAEAKTEAATDLVKDLKKIQTAETPSKPTEPPKTYISPIEAPGDGTLKRWGVGMWIVFIIAAFLLIWSIYHHFHK